MSVRDLAPVVLLPGLLDDIQMWRHQLDHLGDVARPIAVDLLDQETVGDGAARVLDTISGSFALVGFSMGGYVAFEILRRARERVTKLALIGTSARADNEERTADRHRQIALAQSGKYPAIVDQALPNVIHPSRHNDEALMTELRTMALRVGAEAFVRQQRTIMSRPDSRPDLAAIDCPTLVICGRQDTLIPPEHSEEMGDGISGARVTLIEDCNHYAPMERPHAVTALLQQWLRYG
ncbi:MAG: alpha/beta fold hydrolase [Pseudomonadota bacterium]